MLNRPTWEGRYASKLLNEVEAITHLEYNKILELLDKPIPSNTDEVVKWLVDQRLLIEDANGSGYYITNLGAIAAAKDLNKFDGLSRKAVRLIKYDGRDKWSNGREYPIPKGYAVGFEELMRLVQSLLPGTEVIKEGLRKTIAVYPEKALRELIANMLIHQNFTIRGTGPMIEIFENRIVFTSPGKLLPSKKMDRLIDEYAPRSRNEKLASAFRLYNICEERGTGLPKTVDAIESSRLPPLKLEEIEDNFTATVYAPKEYRKMSLEERIEACYQHSVMAYHSKGGFNNKSLRDRFGMRDKQASQISILIKQAIEARRIKPENPDNISRRFTFYVPYWA